MVSRLKLWGVLIPSQSTADWLVAKNRTYGEIIILVFMLKFVEQSKKCQNLCPTNQDLQNNPMTDQVSLITFKRYCPYTASEVHVGNSGA